jgi:hypothetical protein
MAIHMGWRSGSQEAVLVDIGKDKCLYLAWSAVLRIKALTNSLRTLDSLSAPRNKIRLHAKSLLGGRSHCNTITSQQQRSCLNEERYRGSINDKGKCFFVTAIVPAFINGTPLFRLPMQQPPITYSGGCAIKTVKSVFYSRLARLERRKRRLIFYGMLHLRNRLTPV